MLTKLINPHITCLIAFLTNALYVLLVIDPFIYHSITDITSVAVTFKRGI